MARRQRNHSNPDTPPPSPPKGLDAMALATLAGTIAVLVISFSNLRSLDRLAGEVGQLERDIDRIADRVARAPAQQAPSQQPAQDPPRRRGPDPDRAYEIKTAGAPAKGPARAPITIAEFSDFQ